MKDKVRPLAALQYAFIGVSVGIWIGAIYQMETGTLTLWISAFMPSMGWSLAHIAQNLLDGNAQRESRE